MRKPIVALGLAMSASFGVLPVAGTLAATPGSPLKTEPTFSPKRTTSDINTQAVSGAAIVQTALKYLGSPYTATGNSPSTGFSCIGFVSFVYRSNGIKLPGDLGGALAFAPQVPFSAIQPGDILYFQNTVWNGLSHAAIYMGGGRFVHSEWYGRGVVVSSFNNDPVDGNYWTKKYLTANRPWTGASVPVQGNGSATPSGGIATTGPSATTTSQVTTGPSGIVSTSSLNVRSQPNKGASVVTVITQGSTVVVLAKQGNWYKVQLPNGQVGWVMGSYISTGSSTATGQNGDPASNPTGPARSGYPQQTQVHASLTIRATVLFVHSSPTAGSGVVGTVYRGDRLPVLAHRSGWIKVRLPGGGTGWVSATNASPKPSTSQTPASPSGTAAGGRTASTALNVRSSPSTSATVVTVLPAGGTYRITAWSHGWAHVQLSNGTVGWISGSVLGGTSTTTSTSNATTHRSVAKPGATVASSVRVHARPGVSARVVGVVGAGTHVKVLGYSGGWVHVRLPSGQAGYVLASFLQT